LFFALTLQDPLEKVAAMQLACPIAYADDNLQQNDPWRQEVWKVDESSISTIRGAQRESINPFTAAAGWVLMDGG
jgi:hypothetical protein